MISLFLSIITPTYNRRKFFPLAIYNYNSFVYPRDKLEWIIVDDSSENESVENLLPVETSREKYNIKYIRLENKISIGEKRNLAIKESNNSVIVCMDDDDYYYPESIRNRVELLRGFQAKNKNIQCVGCGTYAAFEINKYISIINNKSYDIPFYHKISAASLVFDREFVNDENKMFSEKEQNKRRFNKR